MNKILLNLFSVLVVFISTAPNSIILAQPAANYVSLELTFEQEKAYENHLLWGERFFNYHINFAALKQFEKAHKIKPGAYFPQYRINQINNRINQPKSIYFREILFDFNKPGFLISVLIFVILFSFFSMVIALIAVLFNRNKTRKNEHKIQSLKEEYQTLLINYLLAKDIKEDFLLKMKAIANAKLNRKVLVDQIIDLSISVTGEDKERLQKLYLALDLQNDSYKKAMSRKWHVKAKGFRELAFMNIPLANDEIKRCLSSQNDVLRMEAQFAMIRLNPDNSFAFLYELDKKLTLWEQLNIYETLVFHELPLPDFERFLSSGNNSVVLFTLRMINIFKIMSAFNAMVKLLSHDDPEIRNQVILVMGDLKMSEAIPYLKKIYKQETYKNCIAIIQSMAKINDESILNFLRLALDKEDDVQLQIEAAKAINRIGDKGTETLTKLLNSDYKNYQIIVKHVLDKRIN